MTTQIEERLAEGYAHYEASRWQEAGEALEAALKDADGPAEAWYRLGNVRQEQGRHEEAAGCFEQAVRREPSHARAWNNLGVSRQLLGRDDAAIEAYRAAVTHPDSPPQAHTNLGLLLSARGERERALEALERAAASPQADAATWFALGRARQRLAREKEAVEAYEKTLAFQPDHLEAYLRLAYLALARGDRTGAQAWYRKGLAGRPGDPVLSHMLAAVRGEQPAEPPPGYVAAIFDSMAHGFDRHLVEELGYRLPELMAERITPLLPAAPRRRILDLGCGTGLLGAALAPLGAELSGVDLSGEMLALARERGVYAHLAQENLVDALRRTAPASLHAVLAADVLIYFGRLEAVFEAAGRSLAPGGLFAFSIESMEREEPYRLLRSGRYAHSARYLKELAMKTGFSERLFERIPLRREGSEFTPGLLVGLVRRG